MIQELPLVASSWDELFETHSVTLERGASLADGLVMDSINVRITGMDFAFLIQKEMTADVTLTLGSVVLTGHAAPDQPLDGEAGIPLIGARLDAVRGSSTAVLTIQPGPDLFLVENAETSVSVTLLVQCHAMTERVELGASGMEAGDDGGVDVYLSEDPAGCGRRLRYKLGSRTMTWPEENLLPAGTSVTRLTVPEAWVDQFPAAPMGNGRLDVLAYTPSGEAILRESFSLGLICPKALYPHLDPALCVVNRVDMVDDVSYTVPEGQWVKGHSAAACTMAADAVNASGLYGASVKRVRIRFEGQMTEAAYGEAAVLNVGWLTTPGTRCVVFEAEDSRGNLGRVEKLIQVLAWSPVKIMAFTVKRVDENGLGDDLGTQLTAECSYMKPIVRGEPTYTSTCTMSLTVDGEPVTLRSDGRVLNSAGQPLTVSEAGRHEAVMSVSDGLEATVRRVEIPGTTVLLHGNMDGDGLGIGMISERHEAMEINPDWELYYRGQELDERYLTAHGPRLQSGVVRLSVTANGSGSLGVAFSEAFDTAPRVIVGLNVNNPGLFNASASSVSASGFTVQVSSSYNASATVTVSYLAIGA